MKAEQNTKLIRAFRKIIGGYYKIVNLKIVTNQDDVISIEPYAKGERFAGLQILFFIKEQVFELSEYQAGINQDELHVFGEYRTLKAAINRMLKGKKIPIKIWI